MLERLALTQIHFSQESVLYDSPLEAARVLWEEEEGAGQPPRSVGSWALARVVAELKGLKAPPRYERTLNLQEAETVLCKFGSYRKGHYEIGKDIQECRHALGGVVSSDNLHALGGVCNG
jgi:hypothetical protein